MGLYLALSAIGLLAGGLQGLTGFGTVMVALPLLSLLLDMKAAVPLIALLGLFINAVQTLHLRRHVQWKLLLPVLLGSLLGIPAGGHLLRIVPSAWLQGFFGLVLIGFVLFTLWARVEKRPLKLRWAWVAGIVSGLLGGSIGANGPPVIVYASLGPWNKDQMKAMLVAYLFANFVLLCGYYAWSGIFTQHTAGYFVATLPGTVLGIFGGSLAAARLGERRYRGLVLLLLLFLGAVLVVKSAAA